MEKNLAMKRKKRKSIKDYMISYSFILPFLVLIVTFALIPILHTILLSFQSGGAMTKRVFSGVENYIKIFSNKNFFRALANSFTYVLITVPLGQVLAITIAALLKRETKLSPLFETVYFLPLLVSMVGASVIILYVFSVNGPLNYILQTLGIGVEKQISWLGDPVKAKTMVITLEIWKGATLYVFVYISAMRAVPNSYYEVAKIEGANFITTFFRITIPLIKNTIMFCFVMTTIWQLQIFDSIYTTTEGGPIGLTKSIVYEIYQTTFVNNKVGLGAAMSIVFLFIILIITAIQMRLFNDKNNIEY